MVSSPEHKSISLEQLMPLIRQQLAAGHSVRFGPKGTSMRPMLRQGIDTVELSPLPEKLKKYDLPLYQRQNGQYVLHRIIHAGETYTCMGDNQFDPEPGLTQDQMIGIVTAFYRGEKRWRADCWQHRLYCRFWHFSRPVRRYFRRCSQGLRKTLSKIKHRLFP